MDRKFSSQESAGDGPLTISSFGARRGAQRDGTQDHVRNSILRCRVLEIEDLPEFGAREVDRRRSEAPIKRDFLPATIILAQHKNPQDRYATHRLWDSEQLRGVENPRLFV